MKGISMANKKLIYTNNFSEVFEINDSNIKGENKLHLIILKLPPITNNMQFFNDIKDHLENEILFLQSQKQPNLIKIKNYHFSSSENLFLTEEINSLPLATYISKNGSFSENESIAYLFSIIQIYDIYKKSKMPTRDYSLDNIALNNNQVIIQDFGLFYKFNLSKLPQNLNSINVCQPPEIFFEGKFIDGVSEVWSFGIILFYFLFGNLPWRGKTEAGFFEAIKQIPLKIPRDKKQITQKTIELLEKMLLINYSKRMKWDELKKNDLFKNLKQENPELQEDSSLKSPESKWKFNIFSFYCKNDIILKNSFEKPNENKIGNYPSLDENLKSISNQSAYKMRISANTKAKNEENFKKNEEKRLKEIDEIIQKIIDNEKMNFSLKKNVATDPNNSKPQSIFLKSGIELKESIYTGKSMIKTSQNYQPPNQSNISLKESVFLGKSQFTSKIPQFTSQKYDLEKIMSDNLSMMQDQLEKYNVFGKTIGDSELVFRKIIDLELWRIQRFLLLKKLIKFRFAFYEAFSQKFNLLNLQMWEEFTQNEKFKNFMEKIQNENSFLFKDLEKLYHKTKKAIKKYDLNETNKIEKFLNLDLTQNFENLFFIILYLHVKTISPKIEIAKQYNDIDKVIKLLMHKSEIISCLIINELEFLVDIPEYFNLKEFQKIIDSFDHQALENYVKKQESILENWKIKYIY